MIYVLQLLYTWVGFVSIPDFRRKIPSLQSIMYGISNKTFLPLKCVKGVKTRATFSHSGTFRSLLSIYYIWPKKQSGKSQNVNVNVNVMVFARNFKSDLFPVVLDGAIFKSYIIV
jgi:hypothetical protein